MSTRSAKDHNYFAFKRIDSDTSARVVCGDPAATPIPVTITSGGSGTNAPTITNVAVTATVETSHTFASSAVKYLIRHRGRGDIQIAFVSGQSGTNYFTVPRHTTLSEENIVMGASQTIYFQSDVTGTVEILEWA